MVTVVLALVERADRILLIEESKQGIRGTWNLPGGRVEPGESLNDALRREVQEEAGLEVTPLGLLYMDQRLPDAELPGRLRFVFRAAPCSETLKSVADEHSLRAQWFTRAELASLPLRNSTVNRMIELAATDSPALPMSCVRVLGAQDREEP